MEAADGPQGTSSSKEQFHRMGIGAVILHATGVPGLAPCLDALSRLETPDGAPLRVGVIADREIGTKLQQEDAVKALLEDGAVVLCRETEPPAKALRAALARTACPAADTALAAADPTWCQAGARLGMTILQIDSSRGAEAWAEVPWRLVQQHFADDPVAQEIGLEAWLAARYDLEAMSFAAPAEGAVQAAAKAWVPLRDKRLRDLNGVEVLLPVTVALRLEDDSPPKVTRSAPNAEAVREAIDYVLSLSDQGLIGPADTVLPSGATHVLQEYPDGRRRLMRRRYAAR